MVATVASATPMAQLLGVAAPTAANSQPGADVDATLFAQLMAGITVEPAATPLPAVVNAELPNVKDETIASDSDISADLLALSAVPMVIALPPVPALIASETKPLSLPAAPAQPVPPMLLPQTAATDPRVAQVLTTTISTNVAPTPVAGDAVSTPPATSIANTANANASLSVPTDTAVEVPADMQWLRAMSSAVSNKPVPTAVSAVAAKPTAPQLQMSDMVAMAADPKPKQTSESVANPQNLLQFLAENTVAPTLVNAPRELQQKLDADSDKAIASTDVPSGIATLSQPAGTALAEANRSDATRVQLHNAVGSHQWATELGNKLALLATKDTQSATLYMTPADLGPVQVRIDMNQDQASVWFTAEHADTRTALEQALPRLRELFTAQGMSLTDAGVFGNRSQGQQQQPQSFANNSTLLGSFASDDALADTATVRSISLGMLDAYA